MKSNHTLLTVALLTFTLLFMTGHTAFGTSANFEKSDLMKACPALKSSMAFDLDDPIDKKKKKKRRNPYLPVRLFEKGQWDARLAFGTVPTYLKDNARILMPPIEAGITYRISEHFSIGSAIGHSASRSQPAIIGDGELVTWTNNTTFLLLRPGVHITKIENWDFYGGFAVGANFIRVKGTSTMSNEDLLEMEGHLGIQRSQANATFSGFTGFRRVVSPRWTVGGEIGSGISFLTVGATFKISKSKTDPR